MVPRENKNDAYAKFGGTNKEYYGILPIQLHFHANFSFCGVKFKWPLRFRLKTTIS